MDINPRIQSIKEWYNKNEKIILLSICFTSVFLLGFFAGRITGFKTEVPTITIEKSQLHDTVFKENFQLDKVLGESSAETQQAVKPGDCKSGQIKGNISSSSRIYHMPGGSFYNRTQAEMCFNTEEEAQAAGFRKSSR